MSAIDKLGSIKNKILDKLITKESVSEIKERSVLKGAYLKQLFKYIFLKKFKIKGDMNSVDLFFTEGSMYNKIKILSVVSLGLVSVSTLVGFLFGLNFQLFIPSFIVFFILYLILTLIVLPIIWFIDKKNVNDKFNPENLAKIKETIFENYNEKEIKQLLSGSLTKDELVNIFEKIKELIGEEYFLEVFKGLKINKDGMNISDPYILLSVIDEIIKNKEKIDHANEEMENNQMIMSSLLKENKESKKKQKEYIHV